MLTQFMLDWLIRSQASGDLAMHVGIEHLVLASGSDVGAVALWLFIVARAESVDSVRHNT